MYIKSGEHHEGEIVIRRHPNILSGCTRVFTFGFVRKFAAGVDRAGHLWRGKYTTISHRADGDIKGIMLSMRQGFIIMEADDDPARFILDGRDARQIDLIICKSSFTGGAAV